MSQYICEKMNITATSYMSDGYLEQVIETLWDLWKLAGAMSYLSLEIIHSLFSTTFSLL